jgi:hypothetical protein
MRRCGFSDKMFYYNGSGEETYSMRLRFEFSISLTKEMLEEAVRKTFEFFPEYRIRPVLKDGRVFYEDNPLPVPVFWEESKNIGHFYGSDEVNGYLFVISGEEHALTFSQYHGLTDFVGYWAVIHTLVRTLMADAGFPAEDPLARTDRSPYESLDQIEREDPYSRLGDEHAESSSANQPRGAVEIPHRGEPVERFYDIYVSEADFLAKTHEYGTSFVPLMTMVFSWALNEVYGIGDKPAVTKIPVNLRPLFHSKTTVNFSDSAVLNYPREYLSLSREEQGKALREQLNQQLNPEYFEGVIARKVRTIREYEESGRSIGEISQSIQGSSSTKSRPVTLGLTYLGKLTFPEAYQEKITDIVNTAYTPTDGVFATAHAYDGRLRIRIQTKYEQGDMIEAVADEMRKLGIEPEILEVIPGARDLCDVSQLKTVSG